MSHVPPIVALPPSEFLGIGKDVKERLRAMKAAKAAAKSARVVDPTESDEIQFAFLSRTNESSDFASKAHAAAGATLPAATNSSIAPSVASIVATPAKSPPIGFGADEEFISLKFDDDSTTSALTPARGTKRKFNDTEELEDGEITGEGTPAAARTPRTEGAYRAPWATAPYSHPNFTLRMHEEILDFCTYVSPKPEEQTMREELIRRIEGIAREAFPNAPNLRLRPFGSYATKLYLPISDIDLVLFGVDPNHATRPTMDKGKNSALGMLEKTMRQKGNASYLEHISGARIPILKFTDKQTGVKIDICYEIEGGLKAAEFIVGMQKSMPALRPLTLFLKYFLHCRILNDTYKGGIGSFMLQLMLINHLQQLNFLKRLSQPSTNLGMILMSFLECYGMSLNYKNTGLNLNNHGASVVSSSSSRQHPSFFNKSAKGWFNVNRPNLLSIENPLDPTHDVGANSYLIMRVRKALQFAYQIISAAVFHEQASKESILGRATTGSVNNRAKKKQRRGEDSNAVDPNVPFSTPSHTPRTLLSHIVSVNEDLRPGQEEVDFEEMEADLLREVTHQENRKRNVHVIDSSEDDNDAANEVTIGRPSFGSVDLVSSSDSDDSEANAAIDSALGDGPVDRSGDMTRFEKRFQMDQDDDGGEDDDAEDDPSDDDDDESEDESEGDSDEDHRNGNADAGDIDMEDAMYDEGETFTPANANKPHKQQHYQKNAFQSPAAAAASHRSGFNPNADFIPLSSRGSDFPPQQHQKQGYGSSKKKKGNSYNFSHTPHPTNSHSTKKKSKNKPLLQGHRTDGTKPNNQLYESNRSKAKKASKKQKAKQNKRS